MEGRKEGRKEGREEGRKEGRKELSRGRIEEDRERRDCKRRSN